MEDLLKTFPHARGMRKLDASDIVYGYMYTRKVPQRWLYRTELGTNSAAFGFNVLPTCGRDRGLEAVKYK